LLALLQSDGKFQYLRNYPGNFYIMPQKYNIEIMKLYVIIMIRSNWGLKDSE